MAKKRTNVQQLRDAGVLPKGSKVEKVDMEAINQLSAAEVKAVLAVHKKVGTVAVKGVPVGRLFIF